MLTIKVNNLKELRVHAVVEYHGTTMVIDRIESSRCRGVRGVRLISRLDRLTLFVKESELQLEPLPVFLNRSGRFLRGEVAVAIPVRRRGEMKNAN